MRVVNPAGDVGVCTLWSQVDSAARMLAEAGVDLAPETSRVAVIANLYGNGLPQMLRNLLWNPQIAHIAIAGKNLSGSREWLLDFFAHGLEEVEFLGARAWRIRGSDRMIDGDVRPEHFARRPKFYVFGDLGDPAAREGLRSFFATLPPPEPNPPARVTPPAITEPAVRWFPSEARSHTIVRASPLEAWRELIFRLVRFGHRNKVAKRGDAGQRLEEERIELQNVKVIVETPREESAAELARYGFSLEHFEAYQRRILDPARPADLGYTYGNRLRGYFAREGRPVDSLEIAGRRLRDNPESRHAYISLWDNSRDLPDGTRCPCFVSAFFRRFEGRLTMTATFRSHNAMDAWLENLYGLIAIQRFVARIAEMEPGPVTVVSHSVSVDTAALDRARKVADAKTTDEVFNESTGKWEPRFDPNGNFAVTMDVAAGELIVEHSYNGMVIHQYRGRTAEEIERQLARDCALSEIAHALYLGREIARKELQLKAALKRT